MRKLAILVAATVVASGCATGLPPLSGSAPPELRMWHTVALLDDGVEGVVVTPGVVRFYSGKAIESVKLVELVRSPLADAVLGELDELEEHNGKWLSCSRIKDGWSLEVEGASSASRFKFTAHVPNVCEDGPPKEVFDVYSRLTALRAQRPN
jgi:hypothetical protein